MAITLKRIVIAVIILYCLVTCYTGYFLLSKSFTNNKYYNQRVWSMPDEEDWNPWGEELQVENQVKKGSTGSEVQAGKFLPKWWSNKSLDFGKNFHHGRNNEESREGDSSKEVTVEIWGKAAIGLYLWEHIFNGKLEKKMDGIWSYGFRKIDNIKFKFRTGPGVIPSKAPADVSYLILVLNGMSSEKIAFAKMWLDFLPHLTRLKYLALVVLGSEQCRNDWLLPYSTARGGLANATFLVYDSPLVDNKYFYQWPLGVATYRNFPKMDAQSLDINSPRPFMCNFLGTIYPKSSREKLLGILQKNGLGSVCHIKVRQHWQAQESKDSLDSYVHTLRLSDLTLSPVGMNSECYRIYEAMSLGSVPVIEDSMTPGRCGTSESKRYSLKEGVRAPLRLLKEFNAPVIFIKDWEEISEILEKEKTLSQDEKIARRVRLVRWYEEFKNHLRDRIIGLFKQNMFNNRTAKSNTPQWNS